MLIKMIAPTQVAVDVTAVDAVGIEIAPLSYAVVPQVVFGTTLSVPLTGCVTALPSIFRAPPAVTCAVLPPWLRLASHGVVFAVFPGCTTHVPDCVAVTALPAPPDWFNCPNIDPT